MRRLHGHGLDEVEVVRIQQALTQVLVCLQDVTSQREVLIFTRDEKDVLQGLRREHLVV